MNVSLVHFVVFSLIYLITKIYTCTLVLEFIMNCVSPALNFTFQYSYPTLTVVKFFAVLLQYMHSVKLQEHFLNSFLISMYILLIT